VFDQLHETALSPRPYVAGPEELTHLDPELCNGPDCAMDRDHDGPCSLTPGDLSQIEDCPICGHTYGIHDVRKHEEADAAATNLVERLHAEQERIKGLPPVRIGDLSDDQVQAMISRHQDAVVAEMAEAAGAELADERPEL
jgi:hypothetical protein